MKFFILFFIFLVASNQENIDDVPVSEQNEKQNRTSQSSSFQSSNSTNSNDSDTNTYPTYDSSSDQESEKKSQKKESKKSSKNKEVFDIKKYINDAQEDFDEFQKKRDENEKKLQEERKKLNIQEDTTEDKQWEEIFENFSPNEILRIKIEAGGTEVFYETVTKIGKKIKGMYFSKFGISLFQRYDNNTINFGIFDPQGHMIYQKSAYTDVFSIEASQIGDYMFIFDNTSNKQANKINIQIDSTHGNQGEDHLQHHHMNPLDEDITNSFQKLSQYLKESDFSQKRIAVLEHHLHKLHKSTYFFGMLETVFIILISIWQIYYIQKILDNKRIV